MWKDITTYSQGDKERVPTTWATSSVQLKVIVTCGHRDYSPEWVMHCYALGIDTLPLKGCETLDEAKRQAIAIVRRKISELSDSAQSLSV